MKKIWSTLAHLRFPFSILLLPVFLFALAVSPNYGEQSLLLVFLILHLLVYPASNGYNSWFDKDTGPIGGLKNPPTVHISLYYIAIVMDIVAIVWAWQFHTLFGIMVLVYGIISKMYSHPWIRLKKYPIISWLTVGIFQGFFTFMMAYVGLNKFGLAQLTHDRVLIPAILSSLFLLGSYPLTQVYQHREDAERGDRTLSLMLGIKGTFLFSALFLGLSTAAYFWYFSSFHRLDFAMLFVMALSPVAVFYGIWWVLVFKNERYASYGPVMIMNLLSALCLNGFFIYFFLHGTHIIQLFD
jgi:4-hydroxybenzoate polyprenyltransferase